MTVPDEKLLGDIARRNWIVLFCLVLASLFWRSLAVTGGVLAGGLLAIIAYLWLYRSLRRMMEDPTHLSARSFQLNFFVRLASLTAALFVLVALVKINPVGLAAGLSTVVINIFWTTIKRSL